MLPPSVHSPDARASDAGTPTLTSESSPDSPLQYSDDAVPRSLDEFVRDLPLKAEPWTHSSPPAPQPLFDPLEGTVAPQDIFDATPTASLSPTVARPPRDGLTSLELLIHGVPPTGAKSRVETQIKMHLELVRHRADAMYERIGSFSHIRLPPMSGTKRKSRKFQTQNIAPEAVLHLEATVMTSTPPPTRIYVCENCRERERKRAHRRKGPRSSYTQASADEMRALGIDPRAPNAHELAEAAIEEEERRHAVLFNCGDYIPFTDGHAHLSARITCYCRHHHEKTGFSIVFVLRNSHGEFVASAHTPPIMIMDDHKSLASAAATRRSTAGATTTAGAATTPLADESSVRMHPYGARPHPPLVPPMSLNQFFHVPHTAPQPQPQPPLPLPQTTAPLPVITKLIPSEGPSTGGIEVTVLGENFADGVTCFFGDAPSALTRVWASSTLVCILPPSTHSGTVNVSLRQNGVPIAPPPGSAPPLFTYVDATDRVLMELALQVVGVQMTGHMASARDIAMRIIGSGEPGPSSAPAPPLEHSLLNLVALADAAGTGALYPRALAKCNASGHTLLHLAAACGFSILAADLVARGAPIDALDRNGCTPLFLAALHSCPDVVQVLLQCGASPLVPALDGSLPLDVARGAAADLLDGPTAGDESDSEPDAASDAASDADSESDASISFAELAATHAHKEPFAPAPRAPWRPLELIAPWIYAPHEESARSGFLRNPLGMSSPPQIMSPPPTYDEAMLDDDEATSKHIGGEKLVAPDMRHAAAKAQSARAASLGEDTFAQVDAAATRDPIVRVRPSVRDDFMLIWFWIPALVLVIGVSLFVGFAPSLTGEVRLPVV